MAGKQLPGPLGVGDNRPALDAGTNARIPSPAPAAAAGPPPAVPTAGSGAPAAPVAAAVAAPQVDDPAIEALDLAATARGAAYALKKAHPAVTFTSGRRTKGDQARAMASNVVSNRNWIEQTYKDSPLRKRCQDWVDNNPTKTTQADIAAGLLAVLDGATDAELGKFSKHLSGEAFDVQPVTQDADDIKKTIRGLSGLDKFLDTEGGLVRWHAQF